MNTAFSSGGLDISLLDARLFALRRGVVFGRWAPDLLGSSHKPVCHM